MRTALACCIGDVQAFIILYILMIDSEDTASRQWNGELKRTHICLRRGSSSDAGVVTHEALVSACGEAVRCFKGYQLVGVNFLTLLARSGVGGAIMADEMGLGKTAQAIAFLGACRAGRDSLCLILVPMSCVHALHFPN